MCNFGLEITSVSSGTTCPESLAQYDRNIHSYPGVSTQRLGYA